MKAAKLSSWHKTDIAIVSVNVRLRGPKTNITLVAATLFNGGPCRSPRRRLEKRRGDNACRAVWVKGANYLKVRA
jgi:hypothetical protein